MTPLLLARAAKLPVAAIAALAISGCFMPTKQPDAEAVHPAPAERVFVLPDQGSETGTVVVTRDIGAVGSKCAFGVMVDEKMAAHLNTAESVSFALRPGRHLLTVTGIDGPGLCSFNNTKSTLARRRSTEVFVETGVTRKYRLTFPSVESPPVIEPTF
ncbi:hypothetical protein [Stenotrophomonas sp. SrG]|uniref:hypothetical protein n=1 Tax=Stenotrophomonas sp. SrG TaxID=3414430 RepID=UPI003CF48D86